MTGGLTLDAGALIALERGDRREGRGAKITADPDRSCLAQTPGNHERQGGDLQRDGVGRDGLRIDQAHEVGGSAEHAALEAHREADR